MQSAPLRPDRLPSVDQLEEPLPMLDGDPAAIDDENAGLVPISEELREVASKADRRRGGNLGLVERQDVVWTVDVKKSEVLRGNLVLCEDARLWGVKHRGKSLRARSGRWLS